MSLDAPVRGTIGASTAEGHSDQDMFVVQVPKAPLRIQLSAIEDLNLSVQLFERDPAEEGRDRLRPRLLLDDLPAGQGERLDGYLPQGGSLYLRIEERSHFDEKPRAPREKSQVPYTLEVTTLQEAGQVEVEPNDELPLAPTYPLERSVLGFTGAPMPLPPRPMDVLRPAAAYLSSTDFFFVEASDATRGQSVAALIVPSSGKLYAVDASRFENWALKVAGKARPLLQLPGTVIEGKPELVRLDAGSRGHGIRLQPLENTAPGSRYFVAFLTNGPTGLSSTIELGRRLSAEGRTAEAAAVLQLAADAFPNSPQVADLHTLRSELGVAKSSP
jgi:hypothetical protein